MSTDADRSALYEEIRQRFVNDPDFRAQMRSNTVETLESVLGELSPEERERVNSGLPDPATSDAELITRAQQKPPEFW